MEGSLCQVSEEASERIEGILQKCLHQGRAIPSIPNDVMWRLLHRSS